MTASPTRTAAALVVGNEILTGKIEEKNVVVLARFLQDHGIRLERVWVVPDVRASIAAAVRELASAHDWLFTSGGIGPTHDDVTVVAVADAFGVGAAVHPELAAMLRGHYGDRLTEAHLGMALCPEGAVLERTTAIPWPVLRLQNVWLLPGVPEIFAAKITVLRERLPRGAAFRSLALFANIDESELKPFLDEVVEAFPDVAVGSYPRWYPADSPPTGPATTTRYRTKITFDGQDEGRIALARDHLEKRLPGGSEPSP